jgi:hypothetical protein
MTRRDLLASAPLMTPAAGGRIALANRNHRLQFDSRTAQLLSLRPAAGGPEFIAGGPSHPVFVIQYLDTEKQFQQIPSGEARNVVVRRPQKDLLQAEFIGLGGKDLDATVTVRIENTLSRWSIAVRNHTGLLITDVQFPFVVVPYSLGGTPGSEALLRPLISGQLIRAPKPADFEQDSPKAWQFLPENHDTWHYPGLTFAQFLACYGSRAGVYIACDDTSGAVKWIKPVHRDPGIRLGIAHAGDWPTRGERKLEYDVVLRTFTGDWYDAAEIYRDWSLKQTWARTPLHERRDIPAWLLKSPPHIIVRIQGQVDDGPAPPNQEFLPYRKIIPLIEPIAQRAGSGVVPVIMSWERPGPWIYPDCFPPAGGEESLREFTQLARQRDWHIGTFCNGTRWVTGHRWTRYDGTGYFEERGGARSVCRTHDGRLWPEDWDRTWRPSYACCLGTRMTREIAADFVRRVIGYGLDWVQFLDQNVGCATFPCYAADHGHPPAPGRWMTAEMRALLDRFDAVAHEAGRPIAFSVESPPNEYFMPRFQICDVRIVPPGHTGWERWFLPLYHFLYHEFILIQGGFGNAPEPYHMPIRNAYNLVAGEIPGAVITGDGRLLNRDTSNWAPWNPQVGDNEDSLEMLRSTATLRREKAADFLVYGRMLRPADIAGIPAVNWTYQQRQHRIPAVFHSAWRSPKGGFALVLANWTKDTQTVTAADPRLGPRCRQTVSAKELASTLCAVKSGKTGISLPPLSCALIEKV